MSQKDKLQYIDLIEEFLFQEIEMYFSISERATDFWNKLISCVDCYVFGGFIVDFLNNDKKHRDIDIVIDSFNQNTLGFINDFGGVRNSFGGVKFFIDGIIIDVWAIKDTWAIKKMNYMDFDLIDLLPSTSFFNSTAIIFSIQTRKMKFHKKFLEYLNCKKLDILFEDNPYPALCILKSYQYHRSGISFSKKLNTYLFERFNIYWGQLSDMQLKHFGFLKYSQDELMEFYNVIYSNQKRSTKEKSSINADQLVLF